MFSGDDPLDFRFPRWRHFAALCNLLQRQIHGTPQQIDPALKGLLVCSRAQRLLAQQFEEKTAILVISENIGTRIAARRQVRSFVRRGSTLE
jgi:hypothetical protein